jgi:RimJ/RimL family protein N-acetyltransferase
LGGRGSRPAATTVEPPELVTQRLRLRPQTPDDVEANLAMDLDPEVHRYMFDLDKPPG